MHRTAARLATCLLAGAATVLVAVPAASAKPAHEPGAALPETSSAAHLKAPVFTLPFGRKLG